MLEQQVREDNSPGLDPWIVSKVPAALPIGLPEFVGRSSELAQIANLVEASRVVTLTGPPGIGKTRLAIEVAIRLVDSYSDGAWFVDLAPVSDPELVPQAAAAAVGLEPEPGRDPLDVLCARLSSSSGLLVLDNCEHLLEASASLATRLTDQCDGLTILATSQQALGIGAERAATITALSLPEPRPVPSIASALESEAVSLFCARASEGHRGFRLTEEVLAPIAEICHRLDGIPLAIELAAARVAVLGPVEIAERIEQRFTLLTQGYPEGPARHRTLEAALDWGHEQLAEDEAILFRRLSVFSGSAGLAAVEEVCSGKGVPRDDIVELLTSLVAKSLVLADTSRARARYHMLDTIRAYGRKRLDEAGERDAVCARHVAWCTGLVERSWHKIVVGDTRVVVDLLEADHDNLRAAMAWTTRAHPQAGLRLAAAMSPFWKTRGYFREGRQWLRRMLDAGDSASPGSTGAPAPPALRARALWGFGMLSALQGDVAAARPALEESLDLAQEANLPRAQSQALNMLGFISIFAQDPVAAKPALEESVIMARAAGDYSSVTAALALLGRAHLYLAEIDEAKAVFEECCKLADDGSYRALVGLGWAASAAGHEDRAQQLFEQALPLSRDAGDRFELALILSFLGELAWARGELATARSQMEEGAELSRAMGAPFPLVRCLLGLAGVSHAEGDSGAAAGFIADACEISRSTRLPYALVRCLHGSGAAKSATGDVAGAKADYEEAVVLARANSDRAGEALSLQGLARLARGKGADDEAIGLLHEALGLQAEIGDAGIPTSMEAIAGMGADQGRPAHAARLFGAAEALRTATGAARRPDETAAYDADMAHLHAVLEPAALADAWVEGAALSRDEAVALALRGRCARDPDRPALGWASLTPSERQIVDLVTQGMTNREVAEKLFVSARTVQGHLIRVFRKVGVASRRELREARRLTWDTPENHGAKHLQDVDVA